MISPEDIQALMLTLELAGVVTFILLLVGTPISWWLARTSSRLKAPISAIVTLPLVLPPSVLGFYILIALGQDGLITDITQFMGWELKPFTFQALVFASVIYSLPFTIQPLENAFESIDEQVLEAASMLRASPSDIFFSIVMPLSVPGFVSAAIMTFAHTIGEFGVILMIGGSIPGETRVASVQIYDHVESLAFDNAHALSMILLIFSFAVLLSMQIWRGSFNQRNRKAMHG